MHAVPHHLGQDQIQQQTVPLLTWRHLHFLSLPEARCWVNIFNSTLLRWKLSCWSFQTTLCCHCLNNRIHTKVQVNSVDSPIWTPLQRLTRKCGALCFYHPIYCRRPRILYFVSACRSVTQIHCLINTNGRTVNLVI